MSRPFTSKGIVALIAFVLIAVAGSPAIARTIMNGKEVTPYVGHIVSHDERTGAIVVKTAKSTGRWRLSRRAGAFYREDRIQLSVVWHNSKEIRVHVSNDGEVQRITVLSWK